MNYIGLDENQSQELIKNLKSLLADYSVFYQNVRGYHWNIKGDKFFELHVKFEELYNDLVLKIDEVAERILTLGGTPAHQYSLYLKESDIQESNEVSDGKVAVKSILESIKIIMVKQRTLLELSGEANDEGTNALMSDYVREQEKLVWMYRSFLGEK